MRTDGYYRAIGLMSGTSADGVDIGLLETDGGPNLTLLTTSFMAYPDDLQDRILKATTAKTKAGYKKLENDITAFQIQSVAQFIKHYDIKDVDVIGFHGQTVDHIPPVYDEAGNCIKKGETIQLGDGQAMAKALSIPVVYSFRQNDMEHGGQGAPFAPLFHWALFRNLSRKIEYPAVWLNIGGVANVTYVPTSISEPESMKAFDTGPGNALIDDWVRYKTDGRQAYDESGALALKGMVDSAIVNEALNNSYFTQTGPKSMDRQLMHSVLETCKKRDVSLEDGAMILAALTVECIKKAFEQLDIPPKTIIVTGGGVHNQAIMRGLESLARHVISGNALRLHQESVEAYAFAYLAVRSLLGLPLSFPGTTRVTEPVSGGSLAEIRKEV